jgi:hypothetical protein
MKPASQTRYGPPEVVQVGEVDKPTATDHELLVAVCGPEHLELVRSLGAPRVIDHTAEDLTTDTQRYDALHDAVGKSSSLRCRRVLKPGGVHVSSDGGPLNQNFLLLPVTPLFRRHAHLGRDHPAARAGHRPGRRDGQAVDQPLRDTLPWPCPPCRRPPSRGNDRTAIRPPGLRYPHFLASGGSSASAPLWQGDLTRRVQGYLIT